MLNVKITEVARVDSKGRITIPMIMRESLNIVEGMHVVLIADTDKKEILLSPLIPPKALVYEIYLEIEDQPGVLAKVTSKLAEYNVDLVAAHCTSIKRGETAECAIIADFTQCSEDPEKVRQDLAKMPITKMAVIRPLKRVRESS